MTSVINKPRWALTTAAITLGVFGSLLATQAQAFAISAPPSCSVRSGTTVCTTPR